MEISLDKLREPFISGLTGTVLAITITFGIAQVHPTEDLAWALYAVGFASFFSGFFSSYYSKQ